MNIFPKAIVFSLAAALAAVSCTPVDVGDEITSEEAASEQAVSTSSSTTATDDTSSTTETIDTSSTTETVDTSQDLPLSIPESVQGSWRFDDGTPVSAEACDPNANANIGKVFIIRADGYNLFEEGGRLLEVHRRSDTLIEATFDTTYADTPTQDRMTFSLLDDGSLTIDAWSDVRLLACPS